MIAATNIHDSERHRGIVRVNRADADDSICNSHPLRGVAVSTRFRATSGFSPLKTLGGGR
jgi:hypothetical protein